MASVRRPRAAPPRASHSASAPSARGTSVPPRAPRHRATAAQIFLTSRKAARPRPAGAPRAAAPRGAPRCSLRRYERRTRRLTVPPSGAAARPPGPASAARHTVSRAPEASRGLPRRDPRRRAPSAAHRPHGEPGLGVAKGAGQGRAGSGRQGGAGRQGPRLRRSPQSAQREPSTLHPGTLVHGSPHLHVLAARALHPRPALVPFCGRAATHLGISSVLWSHRLVSTPTSSMCTIGARLFWGYRDCMRAKPSGYVIRGDRDDDTWARRHCGRGRFIAVAPTPSAAPSSADRAVEGLRGPAPWPGIAGHRPASPGAGRHAPPPGSAASGRQSSATLLRQLSRAAPCAGFLAPGFACGHLWLGTNRHRRRQQSWRARGVLEPRGRLHLCGLLRDA